MKIIIIIFTALTFNMLGALANTYGYVDEEINKSPVGIIADNSDNLNKSDELQQARVAVTVTDENGNPLPGVTVTVKGTTLGGLTDGSGKYTISNVPENSTLVFSFIGMKTQEIPASGRAQIDVVLKEEDTVLDEVVVIGYGTQKKINLTGAVSTVDSKVLESRPIANVGQGLQGTISNLNITQTSGALGASPAYNIRGNTSINGGSPLILVNGIPMDVNLLNPNDIENVTVLKDAASAAIYGARAAYGVILITTKSGSQSKPKISLSSNYAISSPIVYFETMNTLERMAFMNEGNMRVNGVPYYQFDQYYEAAILNHINNGGPETFQHPNSPLSEYAFSANTDWVKETLRDSWPRMQHTASISGGTGGFTYYSSLSYFKEEGIPKNFDENLKRYNFMTNLSYDVNKWFKLGTKISVNQSKKVYPTNDSANNFEENRNMFQSHQWPNWPVYLPDGNYAFAGSVPNLVQVQKEGGYRQRDINDYWLTGMATLTPIKNMSFNFDYSFNVKDTEEFEYRKQLPMYNRIGFANFYPYTNPSQVIRRNFNATYAVINAYADYENTFGRHYVKGMVGFNQENMNFETFSATRQKLMVPTIPYMSLSYGERYATDGAEEFALRGAFTRFNYSFDNRYLFEFNGRYDGTSKFGKEDRFAFFPSASLGWRIDNESFFSGLKGKINMLKFRVSYGTLGNQVVSTNYPYGNYPYIAVFGTAAVNYAINSEQPMTAYAPGLVSPTLTWESVSQSDIGLDFAILNNKLSGTIDIYRRDTKNMLTPSATLPAVLAVSEPQANAADLKTTGFDLTLDWKHSVGKVTYGITFLLSDYKAEIMKYSNPAGLISSYYVGRSMGEIWGLRTGGFFQTDAEAAALDQNNISARKRQAGDIWFVDLNGDGKITRGKQTLEDHGDMEIIGDNTPRFSYGFRPNVAWNGFDFDLFIQGIAKRDMILDGNYWIAAYNSEWQVQGKELADWWSPTNPDAYYPRPLVTGGVDVTTNQTRFMQDASYLRIKQLTFGYTIPVDLTKKVGIERVRVYFSGNNVYTLTKMVKVADPEQTGSISYPLTRSLSFGLNIDF